MQERTMEMRRQGDLLFIKVSRSKYIGEEQPTTDILVSNVTGHSHKLVEGKVFRNDNPNWENRGNFYLELINDSEVIHPEHGAVQLSAGTWEVRRQREVNGYVRD